MEKNEAPYLPALRYAWLTRLYDPIVALTTRERLFKSRLIEQARIPEQADVLDVGCGTGTLAVMIKRRYPRATVTGIDADPHILAIAARKAQTHGTAVRFDRGYSYALPYDDDRFTRVLSSLFFHHLTRTHKERTFREIHRVLAPGGEFHVADWGQPRHLLARGLFLTIRLLDGFETTEDNVAGRLPRLMVAAGFKNVGVVGHVSTIYGTLTLYRARKSSPVLRNARPRDGEGAPRRLNTTNPGSAACDKEQT